jgi:hypothetical protein
MGQYYHIVNLTKKQYLHPHHFGDGLKLLEFGSSGSGTMLGLAVLLANSNGRGGGDLQSENPIIGSWAGDRIVIAGDYAEKGDKGEAMNKEGNLFGRCEGFEDISYKVVEALCDDRWIREDFAKKLQQYSFSFGEKLPRKLRDKIGMPTHAT